MTSALLMATFLFGTAPQAPIQVGVHLDVLQVAALGFSGGVSGRAGEFGLYLEGAYLPTRVTRGIFGAAHAGSIETMTVGLIAGCRYYPFEGSFTPFFGVGLGGASFLVRGPQTSRAQVTGSLWRAEAGLHWTPWRDDGATVTWWRKLWFGASASAVFLGIADPPPGAPEVAVHPSILVGFWY
jgi:hypothetical protein